MSKYRIKEFLAYVLPHNRIMYCVRRPRLTKVCLTFDDGPDPENTPQVLEALSKLSAKATFFVIGERAAAYPDLIREIVVRGHEIGSHGTSHISMKELTKTKFREDIIQTDRIIQKITKTPILYRPPYGELCLSYLPIIWKLGKSVVMWNIDSRDFEAGTVENTLVNVNTDEIKGGDVVLFHDTTKITAYAVLRAGRELQRRGLTFGSVSEVLEETMI